MQAQESAKYDGPIAVDEKPLGDLAINDMTEDGSSARDDMEPTEEDYKSMREVADTLPISAYLVILIEFCERFTFYGLSGPFQNYVQYPNPPSCKSLYNM
jgi:POT family proton-dependent oligopeptide transporter